VAGNTRFVFRHLWWVLGLVLVGGGVAIAMSSRTSPSDFGWFAYTPLHDDADWHMTWGDSLSNGSASIVARWQMAGYGVAVMGLTVLSAGISFQLGRRRAYLPEKP